MSSTEYLIFRKSSVRAPIGWSDLAQLGLRPAGCKFSVGWMVGWTSIWAYRLELVLVWTCSCLLEQTVTATCPLLSNLAQTGHPNQTLLGHEGHHICAGVARPKAI